MVGNSMESGWQITCTGEEFTLGRMAGPTKENTLTIKNKVMAFTRGLMEGSMQANGKTGSKMVKVDIRYQVEWRKKACGRTGRGSSGRMILPQRLLCEI